MFLRYEKGRNKLKGSPQKGIQKPKINSLVCFGFVTGIQVIGTPGGQAMAIQRRQDFLRGLLIQSIFLGMLTT